MLPKTESACFVIADIPGAGVEEATLPRSAERFLTQPVHAR